MVEIEMQMEEPKRNPNTLLWVILIVFFNAIIFSAIGFYLGKNNYADKCLSGMSKCQVNSLSSSATATATEAASSTPSSSITATPTSTTTTTTITTVTSTVTTIP